MDTRAPRVAGSRGKRKKENSDELIPSILEPDGSTKEYRKNWARLIQKIYETDPLCCPRCSGKMKVISVIEDEDVIKKILKHLGLWEVKPRPPPKAIGPPKTVEHHIDYSVSQFPASDKWLYVDPVYPEIFPSWFFSKGRDRWTPILGFLRFHAFSVQSSPRCCLHSHSLARPRSPFEAHEIKPQHPAAKFFLIHKAISTILPP